MTDSQATDTLIDLALAEDLGEEGDITSKIFISPEHSSVGEIVSREDCVVSGIDLMNRVFQKVDPQLETRVLSENGSEIKTGDVIYRVEGKTQSILTGERTALNFLQRLSGIATVTREFRKLVAHTDTRILDTRKTTPGWRIIEKQAVAHGGGNNHRIGLFDAAMIKDNHLVANPDPAAIERQIVELLETYPGTPVIIEADHLSQVDDFLKIEGVNRILLDNMSPAHLRDAVAKRNELGSQITLEASGGVTLQTIQSIAETGVDFISIGALTHSIRAIDFGLELRDSEEEA